jgi:hypothetical protein
MAAGPTYIPIATHTLPSAAASYTFNSIPGTYTDLILVGNYASTAGAQTIYYFNGVTTGTPYSTTEMYGQGATAYTYRFSNQNQIWFSSGVGSGTTLGQTNIIIQIMNYANSTTNKTALHQQSSNASPYPGYVLGAGLYRSTSPITSVTIKADTGGSTLSANSTFTLYGIAAA